MIPKSRGTRQVDVNISTVQQHSVSIEGTLVDPVIAVQSARHLGIHSDSDLLMRTAVIVLCTYTVSQKNMSPYFCPYLRHIWTDFKNSFTGTLCGKFEIK